MKEEKMDTTSFCYWLQGYFEISGSNMLSSKQAQIIKDHLDLVFNKVTPDRNENKSLGIDAQEEVRKILTEKNNFTLADLEVNGRLCSSVPMDANLNDKPICETAQRFGLGKCNIKQKRVYC